MSRSIAANRYAEALFGIGKDKGTLEALSKDLIVLKEVYLENEQLDPLLKHPRISRERKNQLIEEAFSGLDRDVINMFKLLIERRRTEMIPFITDHFNRLFNRENNVGAATVYSVRPLTTEELEGLNDSFSKRLNLNKVVFENVIDPTVLGGLKIIIDNRLYDGSASGRLKRLEKRITAVNK